MSAAWRIALVAALALCGLPVFGEVVIDRTRIIYPAAAREVTVKLTSEARGPRVVQVWIDQGDAQLQPEFSDVPFIITPPILRMEAGQGRALRVIHHAAQAHPLPPDRESLYWLNVLAIPPRATGEAEVGNVQFAFRTRIKLFLRPSGLPGRADEAPAALTWQQTAAGLQVHNPGAYHVTLSRVTFKTATAEYRNDDPPMLAPHATATLPIRGLTGAGGQVDFTTLDDYGVTRQHRQRL